MMTGIKIKELGTILDSTGMRKVRTATRASDYPVPQGIPYGIKLVRKQINANNNYALAA